MMDCEHKEKKTKNPLMNEEGRLDVVCDGWRIQAHLVRGATTGDGKDFPGGLAVEVQRLDGEGIKRHCLTAPVDVGSIEIFSIAADCEPFDCDS